MDERLDRIIKEFQKYEQVLAVAIGGSSAAQTDDTSSDIDIYVFVKHDISLEERNNFIPKYSSKYEIGGEYFGSGDEFFVDDLGKQLDVMYWNVQWFESVVENVWIKHYPSNGYTTAFLYTLNNFKIVYDRENWLNNLQKTINSDYPKELKENIIRRNLMLMSDKPFASYREQIEKAVIRNDTVSINHRIAAFLASYFDIIFAVNELFHPGEKRLVQYAKNNCNKLPEKFEENIFKLLLQPDNIIEITDEIVLNIKKII